MIFRQTRIRKNLELRARILQAVREFFIARDYLEVETPCRIPVPIPEAHIEAESADGWFLQTSPEICMKPLLAAGYPRIFQICRCFRKKERGMRHLPEMTILEWYTRDADYLDMMTQSEQLIRSVAEALHTTGCDVLQYQGRRIDLSGPWERLTVAEAFNRFAAVSMAQAVREGHFDETLAFEIEPHLGCDKPLFLYDYPAAEAALAKLVDDDAELGQRFELYIAGLEVCNAFTELNDAAAQRTRLERQNRIRCESGLPASPLPEPFLKAVGQMPDAAGNALGMDRLVMLFADASCIDDVVAFIPEELSVELTAGRTRGKSESK